MIYMGVSRLGEICAALMAHGLAADTPAGVIERGTTHAQRIATGVLGDLPEVVRRAGIRPPALTIVGGVVGLYPRLAWFRPQAVDSGHAPHGGCAVVRPQPD